MDRDRIQELIEILQASSAAEISVHDGDSFVRIRQTMDGAMVETEDESGQAAADVVSQEVSTTTPKPELVAVQANLVGTFRLTPPDSSIPLTEVGKEISEGEVVGEIESLRKRTDVISPVSGEVAEIVAQEDSPVHYGDVLLRIMPKEETG